MESVIGKAIDLAIEYTVAPVALQAKYAFCYSSYIKEMKDAVEDLERNKQIIDDYVADDTYNGKPITKKTSDWLKEVEKAQKEAMSLQTYEEGKTKINACCAQILINPVARNKLGRKAADKVVSIKGIVEGKPPREEISSKPKPRGIVRNGLSPEEASQQINIVLSSSWNKAMEEVMADLKDDSINVVGLHGMGGVGKSTMVNEVHVQVFKQGVFDFVAKVEVKAEVDITRIQEEIASAVGLTLEKKSVALRAKDLKKSLLEKLKVDQKKKPLLIILDDLVEKLDLEVVGIPSRNDEVEIKLLLTSRDEYLLSDRMRAKPIHLDVLSNLDALKMFKIVVQLEDGGEDDMKYRKAELIVPKCGGLPVVVTAIANALKNKALKEWEDTLQRLDVRDALTNLEVSYEHLPSQESKHLFILCAIIRGPRIQVRDLLKYTFGLGLYERKDIHTLAAAAIELRKLLSGLEAASMLLKSDDNRYVKIHDHMRDLALKIVDRDYREFAHFTLRDYRCKLPRRFDATKLEMLLTYCEDDSLQVQDSFFRDMKKLYVLEFTNLRGDFLLPSPTQGDLGNLETLCLHECRLRDISRIGELTGLQILSFRGSDICKLPVELRALVALKMLDLSDCEKLTQIEPDVLGSLTKLEELNMENSFKNWEIEGGDAKSSRASLTELRNMSRLSNVKIHIPSTSMLPKDGKLFSSNLTTYQIKFGVARDRGYERAEDSGCYRKFSNEYSKFSRVLMLTFDSPSIVWQDWVQTTLQTTEVLYLSGSLDEKCQSIGETCTKGFECLKHLRVRNCHSLRFIFSSNDGSSTNLESLCLENLKSLEKMCAGLSRHKEAFNKLRLMKIYKCNNLTHLLDFSVLKGSISSQLEEIILEYCDKLQCIVVSEGDNNYDVATLSSLHKLEFRYLPKFSSFSSAPSANVFFAGKKVAFPCLESLIIDELCKIEDIWHPNDPPAELGKIRLLKVERCKKLKRIINSSVLMRLQRDLESLTVNECETVMKEVFDVNDEIISSCPDQHMVLFSRLKEVRLAQIKGLEGVHNNKNLMMMMKNGRSMTIFPKIESLEVYSCARLRYVLCCSLPTAGVGIGGGGGYANLKEMRIWGCARIEAIVEVMLRTDDQEIRRANDTNIIDNSSSPAPLALVLFSGLKHLILGTLKVMKCIYIAHNLNDRDDIVLTTCPNIELLNVSFCHGLIYVLSWSSISSLPSRSVVGAGFVHLRNLIVLNCDGMDAIVMLGKADQGTLPVSAAATEDDAHDHHQNYDVLSYSSLKEMKIRTCRQLRTFSSEQGSAADELPFFGQKEIIPCLESLDFCELTKFEEIWPHEVPPESSFNMLNKVSIEKCAALSVVFPSTLIARLENLTDVRVQSCKQIIQIIIVPDRKSKRGVGGASVEEEATIISSGDGGESETAIEMMFTFPLLRRLVLDGQFKLERFYSSSSTSGCGFQFPSLKYLDISYCHELKTLFNGQRRPTGLVDGALFSYGDKLVFPKLESLTISSSKKLTKIYTNLQSLLPVGVAASPSFCNLLTDLTVMCCDELEYLFTPFGAACLVHLTSFRIIKCLNMKEVVAVEEEEEATVDANNENQGAITRRDHIRKITFSHLKVLKLDMLPKLEKFSSVNSITLNFPSLETLAIIKCLNMTTFSSGITTAPTQMFGDLNSFVHENRENINKSLEWCDG